MQTKKRKKKKRKEVLLENRFRKTPKPTPRAPAHLRRKKCVATSSIAVESFASTEGNASGLVLVSKSAKVKSSARDPSRERGRSSAREREGKERKES